MSAFARERLDAVLERYLFEVAVNLKSIVECLVHQHHSWPLSIAIYSTVEVCSCSWLTNISMSDQQLMSLTSHRSPSLLDFL